MSKDKKREAGKEEEVGGSKAWLWVLVGVVGILLGYGVYYRLEQGQQEKVKQLWAQGKALQDQGQMAAAAKAYRRVLAEDEGFAPALAGLGLSLVALERFEEATAPLERALAAEPNFAAQVALAIARERLEDFKRAEAAYLRALALRPGSPEVHYNMGALYQRQGLFGDAAAAYEKAVERRPRFYQALANLGSVYGLKKEPGKAIGALERALQLAPDQGAIHVLLGQNYMEMADYQRARQAYLEGLRLGEEDGSALADLGRISEEEGDLDGARSFLSRSLQLDPGDAEAAHRLGSVLAKQGDRQGAARQYRQAIASDGEHAAAHYSLARLYLGEGRKEEGMKLMRTFRDLKEYQGRLSTHKRAADLNPRDPQIVFELGMLHAEYGRDERARTVFERVLSLHPDFGPAQEQLARLKEGD